MTDQWVVSFECAPADKIDADLDTQSPAMAVVEAVASAVDADEMNLPPLTDSIDPDIIDRVVMSTSSGVDSPACLCFTYAGWNVSVHADGRIIIGDPDTMTI